MMQSFLGCFTLFIMVDIRVYADVYLTPENGKAVVNKSFIFNCTFDESLIKDVMIWRESNLNSYVFMNSCTAFGFLNDSLYDLSCDLGWVSVKIKKLSINRHGNVWFCADIPLSYRSNNVTLQIQVPVEDIYISSNDVDIKENVSTTFNCTTSPSRPPPVVFWYLSNLNYTERENVTQKANLNLVKNSDGLTNVFSNITISFERKYNEWFIYCVARNIDSLGNVSSTKTRLNILYPPSRIAINKMDVSQYTIVEGERGTLTCYVYGGNPPSNVSWECYDNITHVETKNSKVLTSTFSWTASRKQERECFCVVTNPFGTSKKAVNITILYPPDVPIIRIGEVQINESAAVIQNNSLYITCKSNGEPLPTYKWNNKIGQNLRFLHTQKQDAGKYTCSATNEMKGTDRIPYHGKNVSNITIDVLYPPSSPEFYFSSSQTYINKSISGDSIYVIKGDNFSITCISTANPTPRYKWNDGTNTNTIGITADNNLRKVCTAYNNMVETVGEKRNGSATGELQVNVQYPPTSAEICFEDNDCFYNRYYKVIEEKMFNLTCKAEANPSPKYKWYTSGKEISDTKLLSLTLKRNKNYTYICSAFNTMFRTFGPNKTESSNTSINIDVLYPASVEKMHNITVLEGQAKNITCEITPGNPKEFRVTWRPPMDTHGSYEENIFHISNISRTNEGKYVCYANTTMSPDNGQKESITTSESLYLSVEYKAVVKLFYGNVSDEKDYTVDENANAELSCLIDSKPSPSVNISYNGVTHRFKGSTVHFTKSQMQCSDSGRYTCTAVNIHNVNETSSKTLQVFVNCSPRPSPDVELIERIAAPKYKEAELQFSAIAYPKPSFKWFFVNDSDKILLKNDSYHQIISSDVQTKLILTNVTDSSYGKYILEIENTIDKFLQNFSIVHHDVPDAPVILYWTSTQSEITLTIVPGFNGGHNQKILINYKEEKTGQRNMIIIPDEMPKSFNYTIHNLRSGKKYKIDMHAFNILGNSTEVSLSCETKENQKIQEYQNMTELYIGIACSVVVVIGISLGIVIFLYKKRNVKDDGKLLYQNVPFSASPSGPKKMQKKIRNVDKEETQMSNLQEVDDDVHDAIRSQDEYINSASIAEGLHSIRVAELFSFVLGKDEDSFSVEYQKLPTGLVMPCTFARKPDNLALNRYNGIYPYDHSRVTLKDYPDFFINACFIDGYKKQKSYIASLGPTSKTTSDFKTFWQMVWHCKSDVIVMLTNLHEPSGMKCEQYWPQSSIVKEAYGDISVHNESCEVFAEYTVRTFTLRKDGMHRTLTHLHYTAWPDKTVPEDTSSILEFRQRMKATTTNGPIIVHCSAGIGRTGTLIAIDILISEGIDMGSVNVFQCIYKMREQRTKMVQTLHQYIYIHKALVNALSFDSDTVPATGFREYLTSNTNTFYSIQYQQLNQSVEKDNKEDTETRAANGRHADLNRQGSDIPASRFRIFLYLSRRNGDIDYINAVYINSFLKKEYFIAAQSPLPNTVKDFLCMLYQENCICIVTMEDLKEPGMAVGEYLPHENSTLTIGKFAVSCTRLETKEHSIIRKVKIKFSGDQDSGEKVLYHFQYKQWMTGRACPVNAKDFVHFVKEVEEYERQFGDDKSHVLVHCLKAGERSGLFCAVTILMEKMKIEGQVNIPYVLRHLRTRRRTVIPCMDQLKFCYKAASAYADMLQN